MKRIDIFHVGPQKSATTWVYHCLKEHPQVGCPLKDSIHYYDIFFHKGPNWYSNHFTHLNPDLQHIDPTPSYFRSNLAPSRIANDFPDAKIILCLRNPTERAFSHYWHEKKKKRFNYRFEEVLENYDLFCSWVEPGFYARHIENYLRLFPIENTLCQFFDDLEQNPEQFLSELLTFIQVDASFEPSVLHKRINVARPVESNFKTRLKTILRPRLERIGLLERTYQFMDLLSSLKGNQSSRLHMEKLSDLSDTFLNELDAVFHPEIQRLEDLLSIKLKHWRRNARK